MLGLDVHARSVAAAAIDGVTGELVQEAHPVLRAHPVLDSRAAGTGGRTYEAGPTGFGLHRELSAAGIRVVAAPSRLQKPSGDRVKTDAKDASTWHRLCRLDEITA